ncbi:MAG TPA: sugar phosphate isomerase/epimerase [Gaiellaceae bacterium]|jgi:sugar phosphate isomerase/epimerase|nr:sugar phosphate isomerase/epimerase [Gaiellaceae bacterium]
MNSEQALVALYWTVSGPVEVHGGREWSLFDLRDRCEHAARSGFQGIGIWHADLEHVLETRTLRDVKQLLDENGLRYLELECMLDWMLDPDDELRRSADARKELLFEAAAALDAHHIKVANIFGRPCELPLLTERCAELCAEAAERHDALMVYEFMPPDVNVQDLDTALGVVQGAGMSNAAVAIDTWHMAKLGISPDDLRRIPEGLLGWFELSDGHYRNLPDPVDETVNHRALPGEGEFPIRDYVSAARDTGYRGPWGVEVLSEELRALPIGQIFDRAYETSAAQL